MKPSLNADKLSYEDFKENLSKYETHVPSSIQGLEELRLREVPEVLEQRRKDGNALLEKTDVTGLVEWKLYAPQSSVCDDPNPELKDK